VRKNTKELFKEWYGVMTQYVSNRVIIEATQWFKSGDHPKDDRKEFQVEGEKPFLGEGKIVRYFRHPEVPGKKVCKHCGKTMHDHGWIDCMEGGITVCPGDYVIGSQEGGYHTMHPDAFKEGYSLLFSV
jgi:hypothetical protein